MRKTASHSRKRETTRTESPAQLEKRLLGCLTPAQRRRWKQATTGLDMEFVKDKVQLITDSVLELLRKRKKTKNELLQRNIWATMDALMMHLDACGLNTAFREVAPRILREVRMTEKGVLDAEYKLLQRHLKMPEREAERLGIGRTNFDAIMGLGEHYRKEAIKIFGRKSFNFSEAALTACGRPIGMLEPHKSPLFASIVKVPLAILIGGVNIIALGTLVIAVITLVILGIIWFFGC